MYLNSFRFLLGVLLGLLLPAGGARAEMGGGEGRPTPFVGEVMITGVECRFSIDVERVSFLATTVADKYRLVRMLIDCRGESALTLSATDDKLEMFVDDGEGGDGMRIGRIKHKLPDVNRYRQGGKAG